MNVRDIQHVLEAWAPNDIAWERDNVGLQVGSPTARVRGILVSLDVTEGVVAEARRRGANLIISHHPLLFRPLRSINTTMASGRTLKELLGGEIACYATHTNLDFTLGGTSFALGKAIGLQSMDFLTKTYRVQQKIVTFVPPDHVDSVMRAMADAGAGRIGNYAECSFRVNGTGTFRGNEASSPTTGEHGRRENVPEVRVEMIAAERDVPNVVRAMKSVHPYEEVAFDIYPLQNLSDEYGMGVIGTLARSLTLRAFLGIVKKALHLPAIRSTSTPRQTIHRVAVCGGAGSELLESAIGHADAFVTADVKYHDFHNAEGRIVLVDAGHYETERPVVDAIVARLKAELQKLKERIPVHSARISTNPIVYL